MSIKERITDKAGSIRVIAFALCVLTICGATVYYNDDFWREMFKYMVIGSGTLFAARAREARQ